MCVVLRINRIYTTPGERERKREKRLAALYRYKKGASSSCRSAKKRGLETLFKTNGVINGAKRKTNLHTHTHRGTWRL